MRVLKDSEVLFLALHVLAKCLEDVQPTAGEERVLRSNVRHDQIELPIDELCCILISRDLGHEDAQVAVGSASSNSICHNEH
jgi:hypothetical protein